MLTVRLRIAGMAQNGILRAVRPYKAPYLPDWTWDMCPKHLALGLAAQVPGSHDRRLSGLSRARGTGRDPHGFRKAAKARQL